MKVYKHQLKVHGDTTLLLPSGAQILHAGFQSDFLMLWVLADYDNVEKKIAHFFTVVFTGEDAPENILEHISTCEQNGFVVHVFERWQ